MSENQQTQPQHITSFVARCKSPDEYKALSSAIQTLVDEATFDAGQEGILFRGMDPSHIALIDVFWAAGGFEHYECSSPVKFGVRMDEFSKVLKRAEKKDSVSLSIQDDSMLHVDIMGSYKRQYKTRLIESSASSTPLPKLNFNAEIKMSTVLLDKVLSDVEVVSQYVALEARGSTLIIGGKGDVGEGGVTLRKEELVDEFEATVKEESKATYSIDYIAKIVRAVKDYMPKAKLEYSTKMPLRIEFSSGQMRIHFYLAPRVQD